MMLTRQPIRAPRLGAATAPCRPVGLPTSLMPIRQRHAVIRRFKEDDKEAELEARKAREDVIRKQEEALKQAQVAASKTGDQVKDQLKQWLQKPQRLQDVGRVVETVDRSSAGKGYAATAVRVPWYLPAFTRRREVFIGRLAMVGFLATCAFEIWGPGHPGPIAQVQLWSGLQHSTVVGIITAIAAYNVIAGLGPWSPTFSSENLRDVAKRPEGPPTKLVNPLNIGKLLGVSGWGFTKRNEVFHGRLAMLGFAAAVINEINTGFGPLGQVAAYLGVPPDNVWYATCLNGFLLFTALMLGVSIFFPSRLQGSAAAEDDIY